MDNIERLANWNKKAICDGLVDVKFFFGDRQITPLSLDTACGQALSLLEGNDREVDCSDVNL